MTPRVRLVTPRVRLVTPRVRLVTPRMPAPSLAEGGLAYGTLDYGGMAYGAPVYGRQPARARGAPEPVRRARVAPAPEPEPVRRARVAPAPEPLRPTPGAIDGTTAAAVAVAPPSVAVPAAQAVEASAALKAVAAPADAHPMAGLAILWAVLLVGTLVAGPLEVAVLVAPVALIATVSALRAASRRTPAPAAHARRAPAATGSGQRPAYCRLATSLAVAATPLAALGGPIPAAAVGIVGVGLAAGLSSSMRIPALRAAAVAAAPAAATASVVLSRREGLAVAIILVAATCLFDAGSCLMGNGPTGGLLGTTAGLASVGVLGLFVAGVLNPPFRGASPWIFVMIAGALAAAGVRVADRLVGQGRAPALRRLDSLMLAGPAWVAAAAMMLHS